MKLQRIGTYISVLISAIAVILLINIFVAGSAEEIRLSDPLQDKIFDPFWILFQIVLLLAIVLALAFTIKNLVSHPKQLKRALISILVLALIFLSAYWLSEGEAISTAERTYTAYETRGVDTGLLAFFITLSLAVVSIVWSGITKLLK